MGLRRSSDGGSVTDKDEAVLRYIAPMQCGEKEREELVRRIRMNWKASSSHAALGKVPAVPAEVVDRDTLAQWLVDTCKAFGAQLSTSYQVAGKVVEQLEKDDVTHTSQTKDPAA